MSDKERSGSATGKTVMNAIEDNLCQEQTPSSLHPVVVLRPDGLTRRAQEQCSVWLSYCLKLGWQKYQLDALENIWWEHHDRLGNMKHRTTKLRRGGKENHE